MVLIKNGIVWGEWQRSTSCIPIQKSIIDANSYQALNDTIDHYKQWNPEDPVCTLNITNIYKLYHCTIEYRVYSIICSQCTLSLSIYIYCVISPSLQHLP